ncbi:ubiquinone biosynthesis protein UbiA [Blastococcus sp. TBT05-19]|uniref:UbiA family prenyltransferase n=1 Tax=Blastococcus sp. TBT05-19 TaxID=2250581 RepID=UPI000DEBEC34|nr:UbiA family prenyltransferase [Blastococcus sp. TBT05-19]RBY94126.1 ubiquinone biosynthesis protein UbiA [Blastococcus sp. TBT05-19]
MPPEAARPPSLVRSLALATHPGPAVAVTTVATLLAVASGTPAGRTALVLAAVLAGQASIGWSNDWLDADRDRAVARADKPVVQGAVSPALLRRAALVSAALAVLLSLLLGAVPGLLLLLLVASGWAYNAGLKRTIWSFAGYVVGFGALPAGVVAAAPGAATAPWWLVAAGAALGGAAHLANVAPDLEDDLATGVRGLPHRLGASISAASGAVLLAAASLVLVLGPDGPPTAAGYAALVLAVPAAVVAGLAGRPAFRRLAFPAVMLLTVLDVVLLLAGGSGLA